MVPARIAAVGGDQVCTSLIVAAELRYAAAKWESEKLTNQLRSDTRNAARIAARSADRSALWPTAARIGAAGNPNALLIAAHALALDAILVTDNTSEFERVLGLVIENWLQPS
jgi:tRNA(fMet)-specific endonuclease VapC